jgi:hypothetical protein
VTTRRQIDEAIGRARWQSLVTDARAAWLIIAFVLLLFGLTTYLIAAPSHLVGVAHGVVIGAHQPQSETGRCQLTVSVSLEDGSVAAVSLPRGMPVLIGRRIEVQVYQRDWPPHGMSYRFVRYEDAD